MKNDMTVVFLSNYFNHHQKAFSDAVYEKVGGRYTFIETSAMPQERKNMGWELKEIPPYVVTWEVFQRNQERYQNLINCADVVITGSAPYQLVTKRIMANRLVFRYSERPLKKGLELWRYPDRFLRWRWQYPQNKNVHLLCSSAYAARDYAKFLLFKNRSYKWGYFPQTKQYADIEVLIAKKKKHSLIWVARFLELKHPEAAVELARRLKQDGYVFELNMIGDGPLMEKTAQEVKTAGLDDVVHMLGTMPQEAVRTHMEKAEIHIFTSDRNEGWGAVLNEAMNSACVPVADIHIGAAPWLIRDGHNGFLYGHPDVLYEKVKYLLDNREERVQMAKNAYLTIAEEWNAEIASERILELAEHCIRNPQDNQVYSSGICSPEIG